MELNKKVGVDISLEELKSKYDAIYIGIGANISKKMNIPGEDLKGVFGANEFLEREELLEIDLMDEIINKKIIVVGGGNVAIDMARTAKKLGAESVKILYRRAEKDMPAELKEIAEAKREGIEIFEFTGVTRIIGESHVEKIECIKIEYESQENKPNEISARKRKLLTIPNSEFYLEADEVFMAIGADSESDLLKSFCIDIDEYGKIKVNENYKTSDDKIYAGGDIIGENSTVAWAARYGRNIC